MAKRTKYQLLQKAKTRDCNKSTPATRKAVTAAKKRYVDDAVNKGQTKTEATKKANAVVSKACPVSIGKPKKRKTTKKRKTSKKRK